MTRKKRALRGRGGWKQGGHSPSTTARRSARQPAALPLPLALADVVVSPRGVGLNNLDLNNLIFARAGAAVVEVGFLQAD